MPPAMPNPRAIELKLRSGITQRLWDHGGDGPTVLFLHGYLDNGRSFDQIAEHARKFCRPLCLDWRGHGQSGRIGAGGSYHQLDLIKDLVQVLDLLADGAVNEEEISPVAFCAHSMGGAIALMLAGLLPTLCPKYLLILDNLGGFARDEDAIWDRWVDLLESARHDKPDFRDAPSPAAAVARIMKNNPGLAQTAAVALAAALTEPCDPANPDGPQRFLLDGRLRGPNPVKFTHAQWLSLCSRVQAVVWVIAPEHGYYPDFPEMAERLKVIPDHREIAMAGASHHLHLEFPAEISAALHDLLTPLG